MGTDGPNSPMHEILLDLFQDAEARESGIEVAIVSGGGILVFEP